MKIEVKDLVVGDEIIIPSQSHLKYVKVLAAPVLDLSKSSHIAGKDLYKTIKCSISSIQTTLPVTRWRPKPGVQNDYQFEEDISKHNAKIYLNLNCMDIFLVKRDII